jgi:hypothetical protein
MDWLALILGVLLLVGGVVLTALGITAEIGVPMALLALPLVGAGAT